MLLTKKSAIFIFSYSFEVLVLFACINIYTVEYSISYFLLNIIF